MLQAIRLIRHEVRMNWPMLLLWGLGYALLFQLFMLLALIVRFQSVPNYIHAFDWFGNIATIIQSTPSWSDALKISTEEWLLEIGQMNYDYGTGLSIWSLNVVPSRIVVLTAMGSLVALCFRLMKKPACPGASRRTAMASVSGGFILVSMTNATMSWVVCCATPSWVVGLAMLGLGVSTSLALETLGPTLSVSGFGLLLASVVFLAWRKSIEPALILASDNA